MTPPRAVAVDLTPLLPGGDNGGAKRFVLALLRHLPGIAPKTRFLLLTQESSHAELAMLDAPNVERRVTLSAGTARRRDSLFAAGAHISGALPDSARRVAARAGYALNAWMKRRGGTPLRAAGVEVLLCPFTAPTFAEPGLATVSTFYDLQHRAYPRFFTPEDAAQRDAAARDACERATIVAAISQFSRRIAVEAFPFVEPRIRPVPLRMSVPEAEDAAILERLGVSASGYVLYPANFWPHKNHELLLTAFSLAVRRPGCESLRLVLTGAPGERANYLSEAARRMGLADRVVFAGFVPDTGLQALLARARALVFPSLYEGFGLPLAEAMACGVPVACNRATAMPEVAGDAALLFDARQPQATADAIARVATDDALRRQLIAAGRERARFYTDPASMARDYLALLTVASNRG